MCRGTFTTGPERRYKRFVGDKKGRGGREGERGGEGNKQERETSKRERDEDDVYSGAASELTL